MRVYLTWSLLPSPYPAVWVVDADVFRKGETCEGHDYLFGGLRFRYMDVFMVKCMRLLLGACADTLEGLRLYPTDPYGEELF